MLYCDVHFTLDHCTVVYLYMLTSFLYFSVLVMSDSTDLSEDEETEHDKRKRQVHIGLIYVTLDFLFNKCIQRVS